MSKNVNSTDEDLASYFKDEASKVIFALIYLDKQIRTQVLDIDQSLYESKEKAKKWRDNLAKIIHPDNCQHSRANDAMAKLNDFYRRMTKNGK